jgi:hypothetical protein
MEQTMSGGNDEKTTSAPSDNTRLDQPSDAVPMENMAQGTPSAEEPSKVDDAGAQETGTVAQEPSPASKEISTEPGQPGTTSEGNTEAGSKGKEKEETAPSMQNKERSDSILAIGPAQDDIHATPGQTDGPVCNITLLLTSGSRHPYKIDAKYLTRRNVAMPDETESGQPDPFSISIYTLKELILREWRSDWEAKPASPSSIRLIHFGKLLDDKEQLKSKRFFLHCLGIRLFLT